MMQGCAVPICAFAARFGFITVGICWNVVILGIDCLDLLAPVGFVVVPGRLDETQNDVVGVASSWRLIPPLQLIAPPGLPQVCFCYFGSRVGNFGCLFFNTYLTPG
mmetsp:Transcript_3618/g.8019  ORF Transcript_3618/g.8019 Transcript_3618/m.8019 type:complete len:106 (+) Transcript_3618:3096-3413(+)